MPHQHGHGQLVLESLAVAETIARHAQAINLSQSEKRAAALYGLFKASLSYDSARNSNFATYARKYVYGAVIDDARSCSIFGIRRGQSCASHESLEHRVEDQGLDLGTWDTNPELLAIKRETARELRGAIGSLPPRYCYYVQQRAFEDRSSSAICKDLHVNNSRGSHIWKASLKRLRELLH